MKNMIPLYHNIGSQACNGIAWFWREAIDVDMPIVAENIVYPDGSDAEPEDLIMCRNCGVLLHHITVDGCGGYE